MDVDEDWKRAGTGMVGVVEESLEWSRRYRRLWIVVRGVDVEEEWSVALGRVTLQGVGGITICDLR